MSRKTYPSAAAALADVVFDGMTLMSGGFGLSGNPENLITALKRERRRRPDDHLQQLRRRRLRPVGPAEQRPDP
jgi:hypothetical protein